MKFKLVIFAFSMALIAACNSGTESKKSESSADTAAIIDAAPMSLDSACMKVKEYQTEAGMFQVPQNWYFDTWILDEIFSDATITGVRFYSGLVTTPDGDKKLTLIAVGVKDLDGDGVMDDVLGDNTVSKVYQYAQTCPDLCEGSSQGVFINLGKGPAGVPQSWLFDKASLKNCYENLPDVKFVRLDRVVAANKPMDLNICGVDKEANHTVKTSIFSGKANICSEVCGQVNILNTPTK
ncbi:MAG: hypothetical protein K9I36_05200 [Bacteroidia bacterium]|nr:hypothetical protein [Bacteroidia bacterium]MCF8426105.1 hypothetical protein [Bacteroidia bacterium]